jgi:hypothetical protein
MMKYWIGGIGLAIFCAGAWAGDAYRDFTDTQGRSVRGCVVDFDGRKDLVTIELENKRQATAPVGGFSEADQQYIRKWARLDALRSESKFRISCERRAGKSWNEEKKGTINFVEGGSAKDQVVGKTFFDETEYEITLHNRNEFPVEGFVLKYCIYYKQDVSAGGEQRPGVLFGSESIESIDRNNKKEFITKPVVTFKDMSDSSFINARVLKGEVDGIVLRICASDQDGGEVLRELSLPESTAEHYGWHDKSVPVGLNK